jgi:hypothetical protein
MVKTKAPVRKIKGAGKLGSVAGIEKSLKGAGGRGESIITVPSKGVLNVRFLQEPTEFYNFYEYWDQDAKMSFPVVEGENPPEDARVSKRYMGNVLVLDGENKVRALIMPVSMFEQLFARFQKYGTLLDRDYELSKTGQGLDTKYLLDFEPASKLPGMNKWQAKMLDLEVVLQSMLEDPDEDDEDDDEDDEDDEPPVVKKKTLTTTKKKVR